MDGFPGYHVADGLHPVEIHPGKPGEGQQHNGNPLPALLAGLVHHRLRCRGQLQFVGQLGVTKASAPVPVSMTNR